MPLDTVLTRAAATGLVALSTLLAACGSNDPSSQATATTTPAAADVAPTATAPQAAAEADPAIKAAAKKARDVEADKTLSDKEKATIEKAISKQAVAGNLKEVTDTPESAETIAKASAKKKTKASMADDVATAKAALDKAGQKATKVQMAGSTGAAIQVENTTIVFYSSAKSAAKNAETFANAIAANPDFGRISRRNNRIYLLSVATKVTDADKASYDAVRKIVNDAF